MERDALDYGYWRRLCDNYDGGASNIIHLALENLYSSYRKGLEGFKGLSPARNYYNDHLELRHCGGIDFLFMTEKSPKEALSGFTREQQEKMAIWTVQVPMYHWKHTLHQTNQDRAMRMHVVLFPETLAKALQQNGFSAHNCTFGYGLWFGIKDQWQEVPEEYHRDLVWSGYPGDDYKESCVLVLEEW
jgi:hypothetical protein